MFKAWNWKAAAAAGVLAAGMAASPASAALIIDNFGPYYYSGSPFGFDNVTAGAVGVTTTATSTHGVIAGGARDISVTMTNNNTDGTANGGAYAAGRLVGGNSLARMHLTQGAEARFDFTYDGAGVGGAAAGLGLDLAASGDHINLLYFENITSLTGNAAPSVGVSVFLTDSAGVTASLTGYVPFNTSGGSLNYSFADFEAASSLIDLHDIDRIRISTTPRMDLFYTGYFSIGATGVYGSTYTTTNTPGGGNDGGGSGGAIPEPATWAMMIIGFGGVGALLRNRRRLVPDLA